MADLTPNYELEKATENEYYDVSLHARNMDKIDTALKINADAIATKETPAGAQAKADAAQAAAEAYTDQEVTDLAGAGRTTETVKGNADALAAHLAESATLSTLGHVKHGVLTATVGTSWTGSSAPYSKTVAVAGLLSTDTPIIDVVMSGTYSTDGPRIEAWSKIFRITTADDSITLYATEAPTVELPIQLKVVR